MFYFGSSDEEEEEHQTSTSAPATNDTITADDTATSDTATNNADTGKENNSNGDNELLGFDDEEFDDEEINEVYAEADETREGLEKLTNQESKAKCAELGLIQKGKKADLVERLLNPQPSDYKKKPKLEAWKHSRAKALLTRLLMNKESSIHQKTPEEVWESSEWFKQYPKDRFIVNMKNLIKALKARDEIVQSDNALIAAELDSIARLDDVDPSFAAFEYPQWYDHPASTLLEEDLKAGLHERMKPKEIYQTRDEYRAFPEEVFRKHIFQEERKQRELPMKILKRNKLAEKKHKEEVDKEAARWKADQPYNEDVDELVDEVDDLFIDD